MNAQQHHIVILGGGFGGLHAALKLEKYIGRVHGLTVTLINRENFFLFTPMLHEVAAGDLDLTTIVNPVRKLLRKVNFFEGEVEGIDLENKQVTVSHGFDRHTHQINFDQLVVGLGSTTNFYGLPGLEEHALTMKSLGDAIQLRNRLVALLEEADSECCSTARNALMTFVVAGGGFAGVETLGSIADFAAEILPLYPNLRREHLRFVLVHPGETILPELDKKLGEFARKNLEKRGIEVRVNIKVESATADEVVLSDGERIPARTLIWTAGTAAHMLVKDLPCAKDRGRLLVDEYLRVKGTSGVWGVGDCALIPDLRTGKYHPPTAQHALREGNTLAHNLLVMIRGGELKPFRFSTLGQLATIGRRTGVASLFGFRISGFLAWWMWRTIYLSKLPRFEKKVRVALDWTLDLLFSKDTVQFVTFRPDNKPAVITAAASETMMKSEAIGA
jgi:NADH dehydrogenase